MADIKKSQPRKRTASKGKRTMTSAGKKTAPKKQTPSAPAKTVKSSGKQSVYKRRKLRRKRVAAAVLIALISVIAVILIFVFFFRVGEIRINGSTRYSKEEIVAASGLRLGENTLTVKKKSAADGIMTKLPFIETAKVKALPTVITIDITEAVPAAVYQTDSGYVLLSSRGKILEAGADEYVGKIPLIKGVAFEKAEIGGEAVYASGDNFTKDDIKEILEELFICIAKYDLDIRVVDWTKPITMKLNYAETLIIDLGYPEKIDEKLLTARSFIDESLAEGEKGILRVSDTNNFSFSYDPGNKELTVSV